jgi:uncharacterized membrane protein YtjA (UPF0391 family)
MAAPGKVARGCCSREPGSARQKFKIGNYRGGTSLWPAQKLWSGPMTILKWALIFFLVSIVAGILGFTDISAASADVARFLFYVFVVIFLVLLILGLTIFRV